MGKAWHGYGALVCGEKNSYEMYAVEYEAHEGAGIRKDAIHHDSK